MDAFCRRGGRLPEQRGQLVERLSNPHPVVEVGVVHGIKSDSVGRLYRRESEIAAEKLLTISSKSNAVAGTRSNEIREIDSPLRFRQPARRNFVSPCLSGAARTRPTRSRKSGSPREVSSEREARAGTDRNVLLARLPEQQDQESREQSDARGPLPRGAPRARAFPRGPLPAPGDSGRAANAGSSGGGDPEEAPPGARRPGASSTRRAARRARPRREWRRRTGPPRTSRSSGTRRACEGKPRAEASRGRGRSLSSRAASGLRARRNSHARRCGRRRAPRTRSERSRSRARSAARARPDVLLAAAVPRPAPEGRRGPPLPFGVSGSASRTTKADGTMWSGRLVAASSRKPMTGSRRPSRRTR